MKSSAASDVYKRQIQDGAETAVPRNAYNTISGLVLDQLKHIPATGEKLRWNSFDLEIVDMDGVRIDKILVTHDQVSES